MRFPSNGADRLNSFALVTYIPDPLGRFLDDLRLEIAPRCNPHAHVSILPPRPIHGSAEDAWEYIRSHVEEMPAFRVETIGIEVFPITSVIYIALGFGRPGVEDLHSRLNTGLLEFQEPYVYHPPTSPWPRNFRPPMWPPQWNSPNAAGPSGPASATSSSTTSPSSRTPATAAGSTSPEAPSPHP